MIYKYKCAWCGKEFETDNFDQDCCSRQCYDAEDALEKDLLENPML